MTDLLNTQLRQNGNSQRRYDIDWLRSLAFILLIFYHIGMFYVADWQWHVKSDYQSSSLQLLMLMVNPWRMPLIFFLSGFALCLIEPKITTGRLIRIRLLRLVVPLVLAMYTIVVPQAYFEAVQNYGYDGGYWVFVLAYINPNTELLPQMHHGPLGLLTWNHLWYLAYLWHYTLAYVLIRPMLHHIARWINQALVPAWIWLVTLITMISLIEAFLEPIFPRTHALIDDWYNHARYFLVFLVGYLVAKSEWIYERILANLKVWVCMALPLYICITIIDVTQVVTPDTAISRLLLTSLNVTNALCWLFGVVALCGTYLTRRNRFLDYLNEAVLPWYILHQSVTIVLAMMLAGLHLGGVLESLTVILGTFAVCALLYEVIRRVTWLRFAFGMRL